MTKSGRSTETLVFGKEVGESLTYKFAQAANEMKAQGKEIISLGLGEPDFNTPDYVVKATIAAMNDGFTHYSATQGLPQLREHIAESTNKECGSTYTAANIIITPGVKPAVYFALCSLLEPGDEVVMISPYYVSYPAMVKLAEPQAIIKTVSLSKDFHMSLDSLKAAVTSKTKCILLNNPHNPTGMVLIKEEMDAIVDLAESNGIYIVADEVYDKLVYSGKEYISFGKYDRIWDKLILCNGFSKSYAMTGWRLGYAIAPNDIAKRMNKLQQHINTNTCTFIQKGACSIYENAPTHLLGYIAELEDRIGYFHNEISQCAGLSGVMPSAGFFYFVNISKTGMDSNSFCADLLRKTGIASTPGVAFGPEWNDHVRFSFATKKEVLIHSAELLHSFCANKSWE